MKEFVLMTKPFKYQELSLLHTMLNARRWQDMGIKTYVYKYKTRINKSSGYPYYPDRYVILRDIHPMDRNLGCEINAYNENHIISRPEFNFWINNGGNK